MTGFLRIRHPHPINDKRRGMVPDGQAWPSQHGAASAGDDYGQRLIKLIPTEALALYPFGTSIIPADSYFWQLFWFFVCLAFTLAFRYQRTRDIAGRPQYWAMIISGVSFIIWVTILDDGVGFVKVPEHYSFAPVLVGAAWVAFSTLLYRGDLLEEDESAVSRHTFSPGPAE